MRWIYISPHFDDAVLSCGGRIWEQTHSGTPVEIWTITAGDPPVGPDSGLITRVHKLWNTGTPQETINLRRIEDKNAAREVGAEVRHLNMVDAIYRRTRSGSLIYTRDVFVPIDPREKGIIETTASQISETLSESDMLVCPMALGRHVDHVITRKAVESLGRPTWYYADIPYLFKHERDLPAAVQNLNPKTYPISDEGLAAWQAAIAAHVSQVPSLFLDLSDMQTQIRNYRNSKDGLTLWEKT